MACTLVKGGKGLKDLANKLGKKHPTITAGFYKGSLYSDGTPIAQVAFWNEFGTETSPPRAFMRRTVKENKKKWEEWLIKYALEQGLSIKEAGKKVAVLMKGGIQQMITDLDTPPNAQSTIDKKGSSNPLIDTGLMRIAVQGQLLDEVEE